ncbi:MAG: hypothetical protein EPN37_07035 [Chitinophagaceae bacterium]|nr:MAG: hypothetical protein EPN37_07035 [Chitinophagaceae bacterium]
MIFILWIILSFVVAAIGNKRKIGFVWSLLASLFLSPIIGLIIVTFSDKRDFEEEEVQEILEKAEWAIHKKNYSKAKELYQKVIEKKPDGSPHSCFAMSLIYARENDKEAELFWLKKALKNGFNNLEMLRNNDLLNNIRQTPEYKDIIKSYI